MTYWQTVLTYVRNHPGATTPDIADALGLDSHKVSDIARGLVRYKLLVSTRGRASSGQPCSLWWAVDGVEVPEDDVVIPARTDIDEKIAKLKHEEMCPDCKKKKRAYCFFSTGQMPSMVWESYRLETIDETTTRNAIVRRE